MKISYQLSSRGGTTKDLSRPKAKDAICYPEITFTAYIVKSVIKDLPEITEILHVA